MKVKIWGARGSIPAPLGPEVVKEKIVSAIVGITNVEYGELREELIAAILENPESPPHALGQSVSSGMYEKVNKKIQEKRRQAVENYVDTLPPLQKSTAGGNTPCIEIRSGNELFIIDAGTGIRELGLELMAGPWGRGEGIIHLLFSHPHWDHIQGFPFFRPAFIPGNKIYIYGIHDMEAALRRQQEFISFPISLDYMQATMVFKQIEPDEVLKFDDMRIRHIKTHHPGDAYGFRFEKGPKVFVYASDSAFPDGTDLRPYLNFFNEADVLIFDAQFTQRESDEKEDWGHSSSFVGVEMAQEANVKNLVLFHYDPTYSDQELEEILERTLKFQQNQYPTKTPIEVTIAQEGLIFDLTPPQTTEIEQVPGSQATILKPTGVFDEHVAHELKDQLAEISLEDTTGQLIIDLSGVELLQVAGLRALVKLRKERQDEGSSMALVNPSDNVRQLIELAGYLDFFAIYDSAHTALNALQARESLNLPGQVLKNRYKIESKIGEGRLGTVFRAIDIEQNRPVAIKILSASFSEGAIEQFVQQARQIIDLNHPNIVNVYDCDVDRGISFMAEEFVEGHTLQVMMGETPGRSLPFNVALSIAGSITRALEYAHAQGVVHGDLKPENVLLAEDAKVSDFGLGRLESGRALVNIDVPLALVTAHYLAPEQVSGQPIDARTDLYALGVILYELFTGQTPFDGSDREVLELHRSQPPTPPCKLNPNLSRSLEHLILKLLDKDPTKRYASARQVGHILSSMSGAISGEVQHRAYTVKRWPALAGREDVLQRLSELWLETEQGRGQIVLIRGENGIGKTRLVQELIQRLVEATVLIADCRTLEKSTAYYPFISALTTYFGTVPPEIAEQSVGRVWREMTHLIPDLNGVLSKAVDISHLKSEHSIPSSLARSLAQVTAQRPWLLVLDNLQEADQSSLKLMNYLARHCRHMALMVVGIYESAAVEGNGFLRNILDNLSQQANCTLLEPAPLTESDMRAFLENIWSQSVPAKLVKTIHNHTQGNPLYAEEVAKGLIEEGIVNRQENKWYFGSVLPAHLPSNIDQAILQRIQRLSRETQTFLNQVTILGPTIKFADLHEMSDLSEWDALESLDMVLQRQLLKEAPGEKLVRFNHPKVQQVLYKELSSLKRCLMHREAGKALERQYVLEPKQDAETLAYHFIQAGEMEKGLVYSIQAATQAAAIYAHQNALYWYTQALDVMDHLGLDYVIQDQRFELLLAREEICHRQGTRKPQANDLKMLQDLAQALNNPAKQAQVHNRQAAFDQTVGQLTEATTEARAGLIAARQAKTPSLEGHSLMQLGLLALHQGQFDSAREHLGMAQKLFTESDDQEAEANSLNALSNLHKSLTNYAEGKNYCRQSLEINQQLGNWYGQAACLNNLGDLYLQSDNYTEAMSYLTYALAIYQIVDDHQGRAFCLNRLAALYKELGRYSLAQTHIEQAMSLHRNIEDERGLAEDLHVLGAICRAIGDYKSAHDHVGQALEIFQHSKNRSHEGYIWLEVAMALEGLDEPVKARQSYEQAQCIQAELGNESSALDAQAGIARCLLAEGKTAAAKQEIETLLEILNQNGILRVRYPIHLYLTAYQVFQTNKDNQKALDALQQGYALLQKQAKNISDSHLQSSFLENVPENKELQAQVEQLKVKETTT